MMVLKKLLSLCVFAATLNYCVPSFAQPQSQLSGSELLQSLKKLNTVGSVLYIAAHPDDENTRLLTYLSKERNVRVGYLSLTRGDGGQNLVGKEQGAPLGVLRTQELLAARRVDGAEQFFTRAYDFGYSKNPEETFQFWNHDSVLADVVWVIRNFKPDVIVTRFPTTGEGGHGHHTASAMLALEAFDAAADPKRFPNQLKYTQPWQVKRVEWNTFNFGGSNTTQPTPDMLKIDVGGYNALLGKSNGEIAAQSRSSHASQGFGSLATRGSALEYFKHLKGDSAKTDLFDGVDLTWKRLGGTEKIQSVVNGLVERYDVQHPEKSIGDLIALRNELTKLSESDALTKYWKQQKLKECESLILAASGLWFEATTADYIVTPGSTVAMTMQGVNRSNTNVTLNTVNDSIVNLKMEPNVLYMFKTKLNAPATLSYSNPYWLNEPLTPGLFVVNDQQLIGKAENAPPLQGSFNITINDAKVDLMRPVVYKYADPAKGEIYRSLEVLPPATINLSEKAFVFVNDAPRKILLTVRANADNVNGLVEMKAPQGWIVKIDNPEFKLAKKNDEAIIEATITPTKISKGKLEATLLIDGKRYNKSILRIEHEHVPHQFMLTDATANIERFDLKTIGLNIGYINGAGDDVAAALRQVGYNVTELTDEMLANGSLSQYDAIVTGVRAYNTNERLQVHYNKLMEYVKNGGNLVVQYNTNSRVGPLAAKIGPYPFTVSRDRVTNEKADVRFVNPNHSALNTPNKITQADFENWIQERSIYQATEVDSNYVTILSMNDSADKPSEGSLIVSPYGKGNFVYTGLVFFRQLPAGNSGAFRLFANLLSLPENK